MLVGAAPHDGDGADEDAATRSAFDTSRAAAQFGADTRVRHLIGLDPDRRGIAIADIAEVGSQLAFCTRHVEAARRDLVRICAEVREEVEPEDCRCRAWPKEAHPSDSAAPRHPASPARSTSAAPGAAARTSVRRRPNSRSCAMRSATCRWSGFFAAGEIARHHLYGYTGVLTAFLD